MVTIPPPSNRVFGRSRGDPNDVYCGEQSVDSSVFHWMAIARSDC